MTRFWLNATALASVKAIVAVWPALSDPEDGDTVSSPAPPETVIV
jgi:hypothetical protein